MTKTFCDNCLKEITDANKLESGGFSAPIKAGGFVFDVSVSVTRNGGDICRFCVLDAVAELDNRPRAMSDR